MQEHRDQSNLSRRRFIQGSSLALLGAGAASELPLVKSAHAAGSDTIKIALVGCGARGAGAAVNALSTKANVKLVAMADAFPESLENSLRNIQKWRPDRVDVPKERQFVGLDAYQKAIDCDVDMVLLCTPPGFRPAQFEAAVRAGKHVFMEKPVATDSPGVRRIRAANEEAKKKKLAVAVGHHLRHEAKYRDAVKRIHDGAIGDLKFLRVYFNDPDIWVRPRRPDQTEMQYQVRNWYNFTWLSGEQIVEMHVHSIDIGNWMAKGRPVEAQGMGGRQVRIGKDVGDIFDHHAVEYTYPDGVKMFSYCRIMNGCWNGYSQNAHGANGRVEIEGVGAAVLSTPGQKPERWKRGADGHQLEMDDLFAALLAGQPYNEADWGADSTMTAILGRMATHSGKIVRWDEAFNSQIDLAPKRLAWDAETPVNPGPDGRYACATPGVTKAW
jgi:myo-inositol 2-dehydrogenase / D-chiro-inositol 1-dehydrogenase